MNTERGWMGGERNWQPPGGQPPVAPPGLIGRPLGQSPPEGDPFAGQRQRGRMRKRAGSAIAGLAAVGAKFFAAIKAVLIALPNLKLLATSATALVSVAAYSLFFGWPLAAGFVLLLFVHEMGHVIALRREGISASAPMFIPFMGAVIAARSLGENALAEARVGLAGPLLGSLGTAVVALAGAALHSDLLLALAYLGFLINLFNLLPVVPLDGGRAMAAMAPWMWFVGFGGLVALLLLSPNPILLMIVIFAGVDLMRRWRHRNSRTLESAAYYRVSPRNRVLVGLVYLGLMAALAFGMSATHVLYSNGHYLGRL